MTARPALSAKGANADPAGQAGAEASFGDALAREFLAQWSELQNAVPGRSRLGERSGQDGDASEETAAGADLAPPREGAPAGHSVQISPAALALAVLQAGQTAGDRAQVMVTGADTEAVTETEAEIQTQIQAPQTVDGGEAGPWLPGMTDEADAGVRNADALIDALGYDARPAAAEIPAAAADVDADVVTEDVSLRVVHRETHLALSRAPALVAASEDGAERLHRAVTAGETRAAAAALSASEAGSGAEAVAVKRGVSRAVSREAMSGEAMDPRAFVADRASDTLPSSRPVRGDADPAASAIALALDAVRPQAVREPVVEGEVAAETPAEQISLAVRDELDGEMGEAPSTDGAVKVLHLELKPASLGSVTVRIALKDNVVSLHIEAQRGETLAAIERDREALAGALASAGYSVDAITSAAQSDAGRLGSVISAVGDSGLSASQGGAAGGSWLASQSGGSSSGQGRSGQEPSGRHDEKDAVDGGRMPARMVQGGAGALYV